MLWQLSYESFMDHSEASLYPALSVLTGLSFFALGSHYWGWCYIFGAAFFGLALLMPWDLRLSPIEFGGLWSVIFVMIGTHLRRLGAEKSPEHGEDASGLS